MQKNYLFLNLLVLLFSMTFGDFAVQPVSAAGTYTPMVTADEISVFLETNNDAAAVYLWNGNIQYEGDWYTSIAKKLPLMGKSASGKNIFKWTYSGTESTMPSNLIFVDGNGNKLQQNDQGFVNHGYYVDGVYSKTIEPSAGKVMVFFDNSTANLEDVYCYIYDGTKAAQEWPGLKMSLDNETEFNGKKGYYTVEVPTNFVTGYFVINNGEAGTTLNGQTVYVNGVATAIETTTVSDVKKTADDAWYTLTGMRISKPTQSGLYIHNGKKVIIRK